MPPIEIAAAVVIGALPFLAFVCYPLYRRTAGLALSGGSSDLSEREQNARQALHEVEFDFQLGNLDERDYRALRTRSLHSALTEMKARHQRTQELDERIEAELRRLREEAEGAS
jgi:predicted Holliday junction resolvase-like endonuclease